MPFNDTALQAIGEQRGKHPVQVFTFERQPVKQVSAAAWYKRAGIEDFHWHDLRHYVGELARAKRNSALRVIGARRMGDREDGAALRAPRRGASGGLRGQHGKSRHKYGTTTGFLRHTPIANRWKITDLRQDGIEQLSLIAPANFIRRSRHCFTVKLRRTSPDFNAKQPLAHQPDSRLPRWLGLHRLSASRFTRPPLSWRGDIHKLVSRCSLIRHSSSASPTAAQSLE